MRGGTVVYKYDQSGQLVHTYRSINQARQSEKVRFTTMLRAMESHTLINNHRFEAGRKYVRRMRQAVGLSSWEGQDGMFSIDGWGKLTRQLGIS